MLNTRGSNFNVISSKLEELSVQILDLIVFFKEKISFSLISREHFQFWQLNDKYDINNMKNL